MAQYLSICDWLLSLSIVFSRFIHVVRTSFLFNSPRAWAFSNIYFYLFIWPHQFFVAACGIFSCGLWTLNCSARDLVSWPGSEPRAPALGVRSLHPWTARELGFWWEVRRQSSRLHWFCPECLSALGGIHWVLLPMFLGPDEQVNSRHPSVRTEPPKGTWVDQCLGYQGGSLRLAAMQSRNSAQKVWEEIFSKAKVPGHLPQSEEMSLFPCVS